VKAIPQRIAAFVIQLGLWWLPRGRHVVIHGWPADEGNVVEIARALYQRYDHKIVWIDPPDATRLAALGLPTHPTNFVYLRKASLRAVVAFCTAEIVFFTHGLYFCPRPSKRKTLVNLWHGDGPKANTGAVIRSTFLVSGSATFGEYRAGFFKVPVDNLLLTGYPRIDQLDLPSSPLALASLGISPDKKFVLWLPTYRDASGDGRNGSWSDTTGENTDDQVNTDFSAAVLALGEHGIQTVVKPHPLDASARDIPQAITLGDEDIRAAGTTLYHLLGASSGVLTDYSSIWTDYLHLDRPIGFFTPDLESYMNGRGLEPADTMAHLPGPTLQSALDFDAFAREVESGTPTSKASRDSARKKFRIIQTQSPANDLIDELVLRKAFDADHHGSDTKA